MRRDIIETKGLSFKVVVAAPREAVFEAWTSSAGAKTFFAPEANIEARPGGAYELIFMPEAPEGQRGSEGCTILALEPPSLLCFTWNAPPTLPTVRGQRTLVRVDLEAYGATRTLVRLQHMGWGRGDEWQAAVAYFRRAWGEVVMPRLVERFASGPMNWSAL